MSDDELVVFLKDTIYGWVGNIMRDLDAQGVEIDPLDFATALEMVAYELDEPDLEDDDFNDFLRDLNSGEGTPNA